VLDLGLQPLANSYLVPGDEASERRYPLHARLCGECGLVQVDDVVPAAEIFSDYAYFSSTAVSWLRHAQRYAQGVTGRLGLGEDSFVVEVASNDGYLLRWFVERGMRVLGVEPAENVAQVAIDAGVPTHVQFFGLDVARSIREAHGPADLIVANNVLAHVPDLNDFIAGLAALLAPDGVVTVEFPHLLQLVEQTQFDTIYHEHYSYFGLTAAAAAFDRHGLAVVDVDRLASHGGSLRLWIAPRLSDRSAVGSAAVAAVTDLERAARLGSPDGYDAFRSRVEACRLGLLQYLNERRGVVAYGAAAKGNTLLNYAQVTTEELPYVVDLSPHKQGLLLPGSHLPIRSPERILEDKPDVVLVLPWNLRREISEQMAAVRDWGGRFAVAVPVIEEF
jgi:SAM-dependent methyltransferase